MFYISAGIFSAGNSQNAGVAITKDGINAEKLATLNWKNFLLTNELPVTIGNIIGGMLFIGVVMYIVYSKE